MQAAGCFFRKAPNYTVRGRFAVAASDPISPAQPRLRGELFPLVPALKNTTSGWKPCPPSGVGGGRGSCLVCSCKPVIHQLQILQMTKALIPALCTQHKMQPALYT